MKAEKRNSKWWLLALLSPVLAICFSMLTATQAHASQDDWFGMGIIAFVLKGVLIGCVGSCLAAIVSGLRRERLFVIALIAAIPSAGFVVRYYIAINERDKNREIQSAARAADYKKQEERHAQILRCRDELRVNPSWITSNEFWNVHDTPSHEYQYGLLNLLGDKSFEVTPAMKAYVLKKFPIYGNSLFSAARFTREELIEIIASQSYSEGVRTWAKQNLELKKYIQAGNINSTNQSVQPAPTAPGSTTQRR